MVAMAGEFKPRSCRHLFIFSAVVFPLLFFLFLLLQLLQVLMSILPYKITPSTHQVLPEQNLRSKKLNLLVLWSSWTCSHLFSSQIPEHRFTWSPLKGFLSEKCIAWWDNRVIKEQCTPHLHKQSTLSWHKALNTQAQPQSEYKHYHKSCMSTCGVYGLNQTQRTKLLIWWLTWVSMLLFIMLGKWTIFCLNGFPCSLSHLGVKWSIKKQLLPMEEKMHEGKQESHLLRFY